jgi:hypothetical protein
MAQETAGGRKSVQEEFTDVHFQRNLTCVNTGGRRRRRGTQGHKCSVMLSPCPSLPRVYAFETADKRVWLVLSCASPGCITSAAAPAATVGVHRGGMMVLHNNMTRSGRHAPGGAFSGASSGVTFLAASARRCHAANAPTGRGHVFSIQRSRVRVCLPPCGRRRATPWAKITTWGNGRR